MATRPATGSYLAKAAYLAVEYFSVTKSYFWACCLYVAQMWVIIKDIVRQIELDRLERLNGLRNGPETVQEPPADGPGQVDADRLRGLYEILKNPEAALKYHDKGADEAGLQQGQIVHILDNTEKTCQPQRVLSPLLYPRVVFVLQCAEIGAMLCIPVRKREDHEWLYTKKKLWRVAQIPRASGFDDSRAGDQLNDATERNHRKSQLSICLYGNLELETGIAMDLSEIRRVEYQGLTFRTIGWMDPASESSVVKEVTVIVKAWLDRLVSHEEKFGAGVDRKRTDATQNASKTAGKPARGSAKTGRDGRRHGCEI